MNEHPPYVFFINGDPISKKRHRTRRGGHHYDINESAELKVLTTVKSQSGHLHFKKPQALRLDVVFMFARPQSHYGTGKNANILKPNAPKFKISKPDRDNLDKLLMDALNKELWDDDSQVCAGEILKVWGETGSTQITLIPIG